MASGIKLTSEEMRYIVLLERFSGAVANDCIIDEKLNRLIFVVRAGDAGLAIGKGGSRIKLLRDVTGKNIEIVEYFNEPADFIKNALQPANVKEIRITERPDGKKIAVVTVDPRDKGKAIGKNGRNAQKIRFLVKRYFEIDHVVIT